MQSTHVYEVRPRKDHRGLDLISEALPFNRFDVSYIRMIYPRRASSEVRVMKRGNVTQTQEHAGDFKEP